MKSTFYLQFTELVISPTRIVTSLLLFASSPYQSRNEKNDITRVTAYGLSITQNIRFWQELQRFPETYWHVVSIVGTCTVSL